MDGFIYDPTTGWIFKDGRRRDSPLGHNYSRVFSKNIKVQAHRLAWRLHYGAWPPPELEIDHINRDKHDNRIVNLRLATHSQNQGNMAPKRNNRSGTLGASWDATFGRWVVSLNVGKRNFRFNASHKISAIVAARLIRRVLHGEFAA